MPLMPPLPIDRFLTPEAPPGVVGFVRSRQDLNRGVPFEWALEGDMSLVLLMPTGLATPWRDADPSIVLSASGEQATPHKAPRGEDVLERPPLRLLLRRSRATLAAIPLATELRRVTPDGGGAQSSVDLLIVGWLIHAGCVRGPGNYGSFLEIAWRRVERGESEFSLPPVDPHVAARTPDLAKSTTGISGPGSRIRGGYLP
jgi:hypothetical protein